jgi:hypothetical protein
VEKAMNVPVKIIIDISTDAKYDKEQVILAAQDCLLNSASGLLSPANTGIGKPVYRSRIYRVLTSTEGITGVGEISWNGLSFEGFAKSPGPGKYFDFESGGLIINGMNT